LILYRVPKLSIGAIPSFYFSFTHCIPSFHTPRTGTLAIPKVPIFGEILAMMLRGPLSDVTQTRSQPGKPFEICAPGRAAQFRDADFIRVVSGHFTVKFRVVAVLAEYDTDHFPSERHSLQTTQWRSEWKYPGFCKILRDLGAEKVTIPVGLDKNPHGAEDDVLTIGWSGAYVGVALEQVGELEFDTERDIPYQYRGMPPLQALVHSIIKAASIVRNSHTTQVGRKVIKSHRGIFFNYSFDAHGTNTERQ
jgi:hypothetical protein